MRIDTAHTLRAMIMKTSSFNINLTDNIQNLQDSSGSPKVIVYISLLLELFVICRVEGCGAAIDPGNLDTFTKGACLVVSGTCNNSHSFKVTGRIIII